jgi:hypothetical protein
VVSSFPFVVNNSELPFSAKSGGDTYIPSDRHKKVVLSNLGLTVFVRHLVDLVKWVPYSALRREKKLKG